MIDITKPATSAQYLEICYLQFDNLPTLKPYFHIVSTNFTALMLTDLV